jgi:PAS domain S-box-containing protein
MAGSPADPDLARDWATIDGTGAPHPHAVVLVDAQGVIRHWSVGAEQLFGYSPADAEGSPLDLIVPDGDREWHEQAYDRSMHSGTTRVDGATVLDRPVRCSDGMTRSFKARLVFMKDPRDHAVGAAMIFQHATATG